MNETSPKESMLERAERYIYLGAGYLLIVAAAGLLVAAVIEMTSRVIAGDYEHATVHLLDRVLLALMLAEIIYTVSRIARTHQLDAEPFLIVGIIAAIRRILIITAEGTETIDLTDPGFQAAMTELGLLALMIVMLALAMRLLRGKNT